MDLSTQIRNLRYAKGWGPDELASRAQISRTALYQIERGNTSKPQAGTLRRISRALGVPLESLLQAEAEAVESDSIARPSSTANLGATAARTSSSTRAEELIEKFRLLLASPLAEGVARIVEESFRLLPIIPPSSSGESSRYPASVEVERSPSNRARSASTV